MRSGKRYDSFSEIPRDELDGEDCKAKVQVVVILLLVVRVVLKTLEKSTSGNFGNHKRVAKRLKKSNLRDLKIGGLFAIVFLDS